MWSEPCPRSLRSLGNEWTPNDLLIMLLAVWSQLMTTYGFSSLPSLSSSYPFSLTSSFLWIFTALFYRKKALYCTLHMQQNAFINKPYQFAAAEVKLGGWRSPFFLSVQALSGEMSPFLCSGSHQAQRDCQPSALNCFVEAMSQCVPPIPIRPCVLKYLGKTHNLWLRSTLMLEQQAFEKGLSLHSKPKQSTEFYEQESITPPQQVMCQYF